MLIPENDDELNLILSFIKNQTTEKPNPGQQPEQQTIKDETPTCDKCGKTVDQKVVNFCTHPTQQQKFKNQILCRECQKEGA